MDGVNANAQAVSSAEALDRFLQDLYRRALETEGSRALRLREWVDRAQAWRILLALRESRGNRSAAARALGIGRRTLYSKMEKLGLDVSFGVGPALERVPAAGSLAPPARA
jgi:DNA-binding NtrC family response regulator